MTQPNDTAACPRCGCAGGDECVHFDCPCWTPKPSTPAAVCSVCGDEIDEDRQVVTRTLSAGRFTGIRHDRCQPVAAPRRAFRVVEVEVPRNGTLLLGPDDQAFFVELSRHGQYPTNYRFVLLEADRG